MWREWGSPNLLIIIGFVNRPSLLRQHLIDQSHSKDTQQEPADEALNNANILGNAPFQLFE